MLSLNHSRILYLHLITFREIYQRHRLHNLQQLHHQQQPSHPTAPSSQNTIFNRTPLSSEQHQHQLSPSLLSQQVTTTTQTQTQQRPKVASSSSASVVCDHQSVSSNASSALMPQETDEEFIRSLFIGDLSYFCTEEHLLPLFMTYGSIASINIRRGAAGDSLLFGFVTFHQPESSTLAMKALNRHELLGRKLRYEKALGYPLPHSYLTVFFTLVVLLEFN